MTVVQELIELVNKDYEENNGRLRLAYIHKILNKALEKEVEQSQKYAEFAIECDRRNMEILNFNGWMKIQNS